MSDLECIRSKFQSLRPVMDERTRRLWAACEARAVGYGGATLVAAATGLVPDRGRAGLKELERLAKPWEAGDRPPCQAGGQRERIRRPGAGNKPVEVKDSGILAALAELLEGDVAGDPTGETRWVRAT